jgi:multicomponent Na+:H+ antiporter subunit D
MTELLRHPAAPLLAGALASALVPRPSRAPVALAAGATGVGLAWVLPPDLGVSVSLMGLDLVPLRADGLGRVFSLIFALITALGMLYASPTPRPTVLAGGLAAGGTAIAIALAGDWLSLYAAWESLALASFVLVLDGGPGARAPALRYLLVHLAGGASLLAGIAGHLAAGGALAVGPVGVSGPGLLILLGVAVNAAVVPLHAWLTDAYPESSPAGTVLLSAFATKAAVYALVRIFPGTEALVWSGVIMALYGVVFATLQNDLRRLLAYHIVSQVGYMVTGVGLGTPLGVMGAVAHAFSHILYKGLLLMGAGAVVHVTGCRRLSDLGGLAPRLPATLVLYLIGALAISGAPLLNGFVSKGLVVAAAEAAHRPLVFWLLTLASAGTFLSVGLKLPYYTFGGRTPRALLAAMATTAALCALTGIAPRLLYGLLPEPVTWDPYTGPHVMESLQLLAGTGVGFLLVRSALRGKPTLTRDADRLYRALGRWVARAAASPTARVATGLERWAMTLAGVRAARPEPVLNGPIGYALLGAVAALGLGLAWLVGWR